MSGRVPALGKTLLPWSGPYSCPTVLQITKMLFVIAELKITHIYEMESAKKSLTILFQHIKWKIALGKWPSKIKKGKQGEKRESGHLNWLSLQEFWALCGQQCTWIQQVNKLFISQANRDYYNSLSPFMDLNSFFPTYLHSLHCIYMNKKLN